MLYKIAVFLLVSSRAVQGFTVVRPTSSHHSNVVLFGGAQGMATSKAGKRETVATVKGLLDTSEMIFTVPASSLTVAETEGLRRSLPEGTTARVVKNTLMKLAVEGTEYEECTNEFLKGSNMWFFISDDVSASIKSYNSFIKDTGKTETHSIAGGVLEGNSYDTKGVEAISKLPSKLELYAKIAAGINAVPTKVARVIKAPSSKLARAIKLATEKDEE